MRFLLIFLILYSSFNQPPVQQSVPVVLQIGEQAKIGALTLKFKKVLSDSRCPKGVTCIWAGEAKILVEIYSDHDLLGEEVITVANGSSNFPGLENYKSGMGLLKLSAHLQPYPEIGEKTAMEDYCLNLQVSRKETD